MLCKLNQSIILIKKIMTKDFICIKCKEAWIINITSKTWYYGGKTKLLNAS